MDLISKKLKIIIKKLSQYTYRIKTEINNKPEIVHQGIQRSGTNYLRVLLQKSGYFVLNAKDPHRDDPHHKHFRWQDDKTTITMDSSYLNEICVDSIEQINKMCGYDRNQIHVLIFKNPYNWIISISKWAKIHEWYSKDEILLRNSDLLLSFLKEWDNYHLKWEHLKKTSPKQVFIINYETLYMNTESIMQSLNNFYGLNHTINLNNDGQILKVRHSNYNFEKKNNKLENDVKKFIKGNISFDWEKYVATNNSSTLKN